MTGCMSSADFFATWKHSLSADFQQNGVPAGSGPWINEAAKITVDGKVHVAVLSDDSSMLAAAVAHKILVYDLLTMQLIHTFRGHAGYNIGTLEFQPGGRRLAAGSTARMASHKIESLVRIWDLDAPEQPADHLASATEGAVMAASSVLSQHWSAEDVAAAELQPKFAEIIAAAQAAVDVRSGLALRGHLPSLQARAFSHDGRSLLYLPGRNTVAVLDAAILTERFRLLGHTDAIMWAVTSPDDKVVATSSWDKTVRIWSMDSGEATHILEGATNQSWAGAFSRDGELVAAGAGDKMVRIWRVDTGELLHTLGGFSGWVRSLAFSPDRLQLAAGAAGGTLHVFNVESGESQQSWQVDTEANRWAASFVEINGLRYSSLGDLFFCSTEGRIFGYRASQNLKWDLFAGGPQGSTSGSFAVSTDGSKFIAALGSHIDIWKIE
ncbi:quinon protein alcohol dehydrogenase-like superfamily [Mycena polygramma]|nr:quinon protein alcohol dehydrogenase-like superfamily [Mycena polygramma]